MRKIWKILILILAITLIVIAVAVYSSKPPAQEETPPQPTGEDETTSMAEPSPQGTPPGSPQIGTGEVPYIHGTGKLKQPPESRQPADQGIPGDMKSLTDGLEQSAPFGGRPTAGALPVPGEDGTATLPGVEGQGTITSDLSGLSGMSGTQPDITRRGPSATGAGTVTPGDGFESTTPFGISGLDGLAETKPPTGIPLPPTGTALPSLSEPVPEELSEEGAPPHRSGTRFILPPIIGDDLLTTIIGEKKFTLVYADRIDSDKQEDITELHGNVRVQYKDNIIESQEAILNKEEDWVRFFGEGGVFAKNDEGELRCDVLEAHFDTKIAYLTGPVDIIRYANTEDQLEPLPKDATRREKIERALKKKETHITCTDAEYDWGEKIIDLHNGVLIEQEDKYLECDELHFENKTESGLFTGNVVLHQDNGKWLFEENVVTDEDEKVTQVLAKEETTVYCDELEFEGEEDWFQLRQNVHGIQPDKEGKCDTATLDDSEDVHLLTLDKDVWLHQKNGDWLFEAELISEDESDEVKDDARKWATLTCDLFIVHTDTEDAEASGSVYIEQEHQNGKSDEAFYLRKFDMIHLVGNVEVQREDKNRVFAEEAFLFMSTRIFEARGNVRTTAWVDVEEERSQREDEEETEGAE